MKLFRYFIRNSVMTLLSLAISTLIIAGCIYFYMAIQLPNVDTLNDMRLQMPLRIYTSDGQLIGEFGEMRRSPVTLQQVPKLLVKAVIATEDQRFYQHPGVDLIGIIRAFRELIITGQKTQGASTIPMQVARNYFLTRKKTYTRKINEILLALKIDSTFSKDKILELYLNKIYFGQRAYGIAAAAEIYYGKSLNQLSLPEIAMIAGLPQAPSRDNPIVNPVAAKDRRDHVLQRMLEDGYITRAAYEQAIAAPIHASYHGPKITVSAPYVAEMARNVAVQQFGDAAYTGGYNIYTTINSKLQEEANAALRKGLLAYDQRHGYRGAEEDLTQYDPAQWQSRLQGIPVINGLWPAIVTQVNSQSISAKLANNKTITIAPPGINWIHKNPAAILKPGDVIRVQTNSIGQWQLAQLPKIEGALVSLNPNNGAILALVGGFDYERSNYNRAIQAARQPGSNFKPFIYAAALAKGYTLAAVINDAPVVLSNIGANSTWRPQNDNLKFYGPTRLRVALYKSRNLVSIRLLQLIGINYAIAYVSKFGFDTQSLPHNLTLALGTADLTPMQIATGYAVFANGGYKVTPYFIQQIKDQSGKVVYQANPPIACNSCDIANSVAIAPRVIDPEIVYLMTSAMQDVTRIGGTAQAAQVMKRQDIAGKTGSTATDAWFSGFNSNLVTTVWVGFDQPQPVYEYGAQAALPIWIQYMETALAGQPDATMPRPNGIVTVRIDPNTGLLATSNQKNAIFEEFRQNEVPTATYPVNDVGGYTTNNNADAQLF